MQVQDIVSQIQTLGKESYKKVILRHGAREPVYGASIEDMKKVVKGIKKDYQLAKDLYATGIYDAMYLAGLIADDHAMTRQDLQAWVEQAYCPGLAESTVPWVAAEGRFGWEMAAEWVESPQEMVAAAGWSTYSALVSLRPDDQLDTGLLMTLLDRVAATVQSQPDRVRYSMNSFVACVGASVVGLTERALETAQTMGKVTVVMEGTACEVRSPRESIEKVRARGTLGKKRKTVKC